MIIGLTGPTGAGKSSLSAKAEALGFKVIDCDNIARQAVEKGTEGLKALVLVFGEDILNKDGTLCRSRLAEKAFKTPENTELLNKTIFPFIIELVNKQLEGEKVLLDAPTLFESGINNICDKTIAVLADRGIRLLRITERDGIEKEAAELRINAGKTDDFYRENADFIIYNNGNQAEFTLEFEKIIDSILGKI